MSESSSSNSNASNRLGSSLFIAVFLASQIALPLSYYLGGERYDERFAWRMFSTVRLTNCNAQSREFLPDGDIRPVTLHHHLQIAWVNLFERNRGEVVRRFLHRRCRQADVTRVEVRTTCATQSGERSQYDWRIDCSEHAITRSDTELPSS